MSRDRGPPYGELRSSGFASGIGQIWEAAVLMAADALHVAPRRKKQREVLLDERTLKDIGVEPGSVTWL